MPWPWGISWLDRTLGDSSLPRLLSCGSCWASSRSACLSPAFTSLCSVFLLRSLVQLRGFGRSRGCDTLICASGPGLTREPFTCTSVLVPEEPRGPCPSGGGQPGTVSKAHTRRRGAATGPAEGGKAPKTGELTEADRTEASRG